MTFVIGSQINCALDLSGEWPREQDIAHVTSDFAEKVMSSTQAALSQFVARSYPQSNLCHGPRMTVGIETNIGDQFSADMRVNVIGVEISQYVKDEVSKALVGYLETDQVFLIEVLSAIVAQHGFDELTEAEAWDDVQRFSGIVRRVIAKRGGLAPLLAKSQSVRFEPRYVWVTERYLPAFNGVEDLIQEPNYEYVGRALDVDQVVEGMLPALRDAIPGFVAENADADTSVDFFTSKYARFGQSMQFNSSQDEIVKILSILPVQTGLEVHELTALDLKYDELAIRSAVEDTIYNVHLLPIAENNTEHLDEVFDALVRDQFESLEETSLLPIPSSKVLADGWGFDDVNQLIEIAQKDCLDDIDLDGFDVDLDIENAQVKRIVVGLLASYHIQDLIEKAVIDYQAKSIEVMSLLLAESDGLAECVMTILDRYGFDARSIKPLVIE